MSFLLKTSIIWLALLGLNSHAQAQVTFAPAVNYIVGLAPYSVAAADINGDGWLDLICANIGVAFLSVMTNNGSGIFGLNATYPVIGGSRCVVASDINGDNKLDLISPNSYSVNPGTLTVFTNNGSGGFALSSTPVVGSSPKFVVAADINGDGETDLISANTAQGNGNTLTLLTNIGNGHFGSNATYTVGNQPYSVVAVDVSGDGQIDLACANEGGNTLSVLTNNGLNRFVLSSSPVVGLSPISLAAADLNGDGNLDLVCANYGGNTLSVLTNNGSGGFGSNAVLTVGFNPDCVVAADVNGDGKTDLISGDRDNTLSVFTNSGTGKFTIASSPTVGQWPASVVAADVNADGKLDLICANSGGGNGDTVSVLINTTNFQPTNPPVITQPPLSRTLSAGADTLLSFRLTGDGPFAYQWRLNSSPLSGATNPTLNLVGVTPADAGRYEIAVIGAGGAVTSAPASVAIFGMQLIPSGGQPLPLLILDGAIGTQYRLETSPNILLSNWSLLAPVTLPTTRFYYADTASSNQPVRFYRAVPQ